MNLRDLLIHHEGLRLKPYRDSVGKLTIGVGRNLDDVGISELEANGMLASDIERVQRACVDAFPWFKSISVPRQDVVCSMVFQMGMGGFNEFKQVIEALKSQNYAAASAAMLDSRWAREQCPERAKELSELMRSEKYPVI